MLGPIDVGNGMLFISMVGDGVRYFFMVLLKILPVYKCCGGLT